MELFSMGMKIDDFSIGTEFYTAAGKWRCTDIGTRVVVAIRIEEVTVVRSKRDGGTSTSVVLDDKSWLNGPPYAVAESVFDEFGIGGCSVSPDAFLNA